MYIVIKAFYDLTDPVKVKVVKGGALPLAYRLYHVGDVYPAAGAPIPSQERIEELATGKNKQGTPLIGWLDPEQLKEAEKEAAESPVETPTETAGETPAKTEKAPAKRRTARKAASKSASGKTAKKRTTRKKGDANDGTGNS